LKLYLYDSTRRRHSPRAVTKPVRRHFPSLLSIKILGVTVNSHLARGPIYKESYARLMTAQHLRRTYTDLVNCERLTKNHKLNLRKIYAKLTQKLGKTYDHINAVISQS